MLWWRLRQLKSTNAGTRKKAAARLGQTKDTRVIVPLVMLLNDPSREVRRTASEALDSHGWNAANDSARSWRAIAREEWSEVERIGPAIVGPLVELLSDSDREIQIAAADVLQKIGGPEAQQALSNHARRQQEEEAQRHAKEAEQQAAKAMKLAKQNKNAFRRAIENGNVEKVKTLLGLAAPLVTLSLGENGELGLGLAASYHQPEMLRMMLERGADAQAIDHEGAAAIHWAAVADVTETVGILVDAGGDVNLGDRFGRTPLHWAADIGSAAMTEYLIERGADAKAVDRFGATPIHSLVCSGFSSPDIEDPFWSRWAAGAPRVLELLLSHGAEVNAEAKFREHPLQVATSRALKELAAILHRHAVVELIEELSSPNSASEEYQRVDNSSEPKELREERKSQIVKQIVVLLNQRRREESLRTRNVAQS